MTSKIRIPTYDATIVFMRDIDRKTVARYAKNKYGVEIEGLDGDFSGLTVDVGNLDWIVYVPDTRAGDGTWLVRTLSHEANHVTLQLMRKVGVEDDEAICYAQDNLLGEMFRKVVGKTKKAS